MSNKEKLIKHFETCGIEGVTFANLAVLYNITNEQGLKSGQAVKDIYNEWMVFNDYAIEEDTGKYLLDDKPVEIKKAGLHIVAGCIHLPFHNVKMFDAMVNLIKDFGNDLDGLHLIGDIQDMNSINRHDIGNISRVGYTMDEEYSETNRALDQIDDVINSHASKNYIWGNHEDWYNKMMKKSDFAKMGKGTIKGPTQGAKLLERDYHVQESWTEGNIKLGDIELLHGDSVSIHTAKKHLDDMKRSIMFAHTHRIQTYMEGDFEAYNIGWMGDVHSAAFKYGHKNQRNKWGNGFAIVNIDNDGRSHVQQIKWKNEQFYYNNKKYS